jgi:ATP-dependent helicase HrpA
VGLRAAPEVRDEPRQFRKACRQHFLSELRLREWHDVHRQLLEMVQQAGMKPGKRQWSVPASATKTAKPSGGAANEAYAGIHRSLLAGLLSSIATRGETNEYTAAGGGKFLLWPGSGLAGKPRWIVAAEMVETTRRYLRSVARIDPEWIEPLAGHLVSRSYSEPHWDRRAGGAMAYERVSLFGLTIVPRRRVRYGAIDPVVSRQLLLDHGLVEGDIDTRVEFFRHNRQLIADIEARAAKMRRRELIVDPHAVYAFYNARLPADVVDGPSLEKWWRQAAKQERQRLFMTEADLVGEAQAADAAKAFPDVLAIDRMKLPLEYRFEPGAERDGLTLTVPKEGLAQLSEERLGWLVPGLVEAKVEALIRALPKSVRRSFGPAPDAARKVAKELPFATGPLLPRVAAALSKLAGEPITPEMFEQDRLPPNLRMNVRVVDERGKTLAEGRDVAAIREKLGVNVAAANAAMLKGSTWHRDGVTKWDFGPLPESVDVSRGGLVLTKYPAIVDAGDAAALRLCDWRPQAEQQTRGGLRRLFILAERRELKAQVQWLPNLEKLRLFAAPLCKWRPLDEQLIDLLADRAFYGQDAAAPRTADEFEARRLIARRRIAAEVQDLTKLLLPMFQTYHEVRLALEGRQPAGWQYAVDDLRGQLAALVPNGFLTATPWEWLQHYPRYLKAMALRLNKLSSGLARDRQQHALVAPRQEAYQTKAEQNRKTGTAEAELDHYRWMLEELRVSLFAQELGTSLTVSPQRLDKQWEKIDT